MSIIYIRIVFIHVLSCNIVFIKTNKEILINTNLKIINLEDVKSFSILNF